MNNRDLTKGSLIGHIKHIAVPASIGFFFQTMYNVVDSFYAGALGTEALAAMGATFPIFFMIIALGSGLSQGSSALIANALGSKHMKKAKLYAIQAISFGIIMSILLTILGLWVSPFLLEYMGAKGIFLEYSLSYINIIFYTTIFFLGTHIMNSMLIAIGDTKSMRNVMILGFVLNIFLDPWFMYGGFGLPAMGIGGIALATVVVQIISTVYITYKVSRTGLISNNWIKNLIPQIKPYKAIAIQGFPASLNMMTVAIGMYVINYFIGAFGDAAVAAYGVSVRIEQIALMPTIGLNMASLAIIGQNNGAKKFERMKEALSKILKYGNTIIMIGALMIIIFAKQLLMIFTKDPEVIAIGVPYLRIASFITWAYVTMFICVSALQGMKKPMFALWMGLSRQIIAPLIVFPILINVFDMGIFGVWWGIFGIVWIGTAIAYWYTKRVLNGLIEG